jgi:hypothetical protein
MSQGNPYGYQGGGYYENDSAAVPWNVPGGAIGFGQGLVSPNSAPSASRSPFVPEHLPQNLDWPTGPDAYYGQAPYGFMGMPPQNMQSSLGPNGEMGVPVQPQSFGGAPQIYGSYGQGYNQAFNQQYKGYQQPNYSAGYQGGSAWA